MGNASSSHTVKVYNYMDTKPDVALAFDGDDSVHITASDHCYGPSKNGGSCSLKCNHRHCDIKICENKSTVSGTSCRPEYEISEWSNIDEDYLLIFSYDFAIKSDVAPNEEHFYILNQGDEDIQMKGTPVSSDGNTEYSIPSGYDIEWTTIAEDTSMGFSTLSYGNVDITIELSGTAYDYTVEQGKCYIYNYFKCEYRDGTTFVQEQYLEEDVDCTNNRRRRNRELAEGGEASNEKGDNSSNTGDIVRVLDEKVVPNYLRSSNVGAGN